MPQGNPLSQEAGDSGLLHEFRAVRRQSLSLADGLSDADATVQSMEDASPAKWHLAHVTWFFERFILREHLARYSPFSDAFDFLFMSF